MNGKPGNMDDRYNAGKPNFNSVDERLKIHKLTHYRRAGSNGLGIKIAKTWPTSFNVLYFTIQMLSTVQCAEKIL